MPPPMNPVAGLDPFAKAQMDTAALMNGPNSTATQPGMPGPGAGMNNLPGARPPTPPPQGGGPPGGPQGGGGGPLTPPPIPGASQAGNTPFGPSTDYRTAMGIAPTDGDRTTAALDGLGKGLSAAAGNSNKAGAVFSRGAGGAITGQINEAQEQQKLAQGLQNQYMNQVSTAFKDLMSQKSTDSLEIYRQALAGKADAAAAAAANGSTGAKAFLNTPEGRMNSAQAEALRNYKNDTDNINTRVKNGTMDAKVAEQKLDALEKSKSSYFDKAYSEHGVDPNAVPDMMSRGSPVPRKFSDVKVGQWYTGPDGTNPRQKTANSSDFKPDDKVQWLNAWDTSKMSKDQAHMTVADGQYYTDGKGNLFTKNPAPAAPAAAPPVRPMAPPNPMADPQAAYGQVDPSSVYSGAFAGAPQ